MTQTQSYSFDRAAAIYDQSRGLPPGVLEAVVDALATEIGGAGPVLEVGVGTGRIALPLAARGIEVHGVDVSAAMLAELLRKSGDAVGAAVWVCRADATSLPVADDVYAASIASLVLHLLPEWRSALTEMLRVTRPGGVLLIDADSRSGINRALSAELARIVGRKLRPGLQDVTELEQFMQDNGLQSRVLGPFNVERQTTLRTWLDRMRDNWYSQTWALDDATRIAAIDELALWAQAQYGDLDQPRSDMQTVAWRAFRLP
jgi:ubiquinone/menaquinone biosynthesis C-methylase UbiE